MIWYASSHALDHCVTLYNIGVLQYTANLECNETLNISDSQEVVYLVAQGILMYTNYSATDSDSDR